MAERIIRYKTKREKRTPIYTHTYPPNVQEIFYGDMTLESLFLPEANETITDADIAIINKMDYKEMLRNAFCPEDEEFQDLANITANSEDAKEYNDISAQLYNFTRRRVWSEYRGHVDPADKWLGENRESQNSEKFEKLCLMYLYHSRYKMDGAFKQRELYREDKRYKIGYLFNRLRRLKTEMLKYVATAKRQYNYYKKPYQNLTTLMRLYERVVRFDVDIRDTTDLIKHLFSIEAPYDRYPGTSKPSKPDTDKIK